MRLKVFGTTLIDRGHQFPDAGGQYARQVRAVIAVSSRKAAAKAFEVSLGELNRFGGETGDKREIEIAMSRPGLIFVRPAGVSGGDFVERVLPKEFPDGNVMAISLTAMADYLQDGGWVQNRRGWWHPPNCVAS